MRRFLPPRAVFPPFLLGALELSIDQKKKQQQKDDESIVHILKSISMHKISAYTFRFVV